MRSIFLRLIVAASAWVLFCHPSLAQFNASQQPPKKGIGKELFAKVVSDLSAEKAAAAALDKCFEGFPANYWRAQPDDKPTIVEKDVQKVILKIGYTIGPDQKAYSQFIKRAQSILSKLAKDSGTISVKFRSDPNWRGFALGRIPREFEDASTLSAKAQPGDAVLMLNTKLSATSEHSSWCYFVLDKNLEQNLCALAARRVVSRIRLLDSNNKTLAEGQEEIPTARSEHYSLAVVTSQTNGADSNGATAARGSVFFVGPMLFVSRETAEHLASRKATADLRNRIPIAFTAAVSSEHNFSLSLEELKAFDQIKIDVIPK
jgi:hypothetical protein